MTRARLACLLLLLPLVLPACPRPVDPKPAPQVPQRPSRPIKEWKAEVSRLPPGSRVQGTVQASRYFPLHDAWRRHQGRQAAMSAWQVPHRGRTWWVVDTRYTFSTEDDAARFLAAQLAQLSEGHPLVEPRLALPCDPAARLFAGRILHPGLGTPFLAFVVTGRHEHHVFKFLAAVEISAEEPAMPAGPETMETASPEPSSHAETTPAAPTFDERLRADFLSLAAMALVP